MTYSAPVQEYRFLFDHVVDYADVVATDRFAEATDDLTDAILAEAGRMCEEVLSPLQRIGDLHPARLENGVVRTPPGFAEGYRAIAEGGWVAIAAPQAYGGMGLPMTLTTAVNEMMAAACLALQLNPLMTQGQIEALDAHASDALKRLYLPNLISGAWSGTMNLTEPQAGSDVGALRTRAEPAADGTYRITGQKIFISWADNDFTENVCHLVLARLPGAPEGTRGISLFMVPKLLPDDEGRPGAPNSLRVVSLEHKMGLHGSPTAVMEYDGATGFLVGEENRGMRAMFTMMNNARLGVGGQGIGAAEGAYQKALAFALERVQGRPPIEGGTGTIFDHADVRRMLAEMRAELFAARAIALSCARATDLAMAGDDAGWRARAALLTPIAKTFGTETGLRVTETAMQVHGGMGYIEETGIAQYYRDVRVTAIYEGTNGIQAMDLVGRKLADGGEAAFQMIEEIEQTAEAARARMPRMAKAVWEAAETLREATEWMVAEDALNERFAGSIPFLRGFARVLGGHFHLRAALGSGRESDRAALARFYIDRLLPEHAAQLAAARSGAGGLYALGPEILAAR